MIAGRYRIENLIGRGGMGEVYRAWDQTLNQGVALKFLPAARLKDPQHAQHLLNEVRMARRVSHPAICRVHDVGTFEGHTFISMELIEGEDLGTIIRRVGRLSGQRALSIAHELCVGLAAAHGQGVLHRDFKPANVLIDRDGHVHIADFGLSSLLVDGAEGRHHGGTLAYMPPEQLLGEAVGPRGDVYCLGLVLYEMFTGKPVFRPKDVPDLLDMHQAGVVPPSGVEPEIDPGVERVILHCLERRPEDRPATPLFAAADLPGGSLATAALGAGLTLSPDLVAAAGSRGVMRARTTAIILVLTLLVGVLAVRLSRLTDLASLVPLPKSTDVLADASRTILRKLGYTNDVRYEAFAFDYYQELLSEVATRDPSPNWWAQLEKPRPSPIDFWYRRHTRPLATDSTLKKISWLDPAPAIPGMISLRLDPGGRLRELYVVTAGLNSIPEALTDPSVATLRRNNATPNTDALLGVAGLDPTLFKPTSLTWVPPVYCDEVRSFAGAYPDNQAQPITVSMGFFRGWPVTFRIIETHLESASQFKDLTPDWRRNAGISIQLIIIILTTLGAAFLARRNMLSQQGDREGAVRLALASFTLAFASFLLRADHSADFGAEANLLQCAVIYSVFVAAAFWMFYLAVEPHARRHWPESLYAWSRLMKDRWADPLVGQSLLVGGLVGVTGVVLTQLHALSPMWLGHQPTAPLALPDCIAETLEGGRLSLGVALDLVVDALRFALLYLTGVVLLVMLTRHRLWAVVTYAALHALAWVLTEQTSWLSWLFGAAIAALATGLLVRCGVLALAMASGTFLVLSAFPISLEPARWYFGSSLFGVGLIAASIVFGAASASGMLSRKPA